jgi:hypothetical protein
MEKILWDSLSPVIWILVLMVILSIVIFVFPIILKKMFVKNKYCTCGAKLENTDKFCSKCGKQVEK